MTSTYTVRAGDTLGAVAKRHGTSIEELQRLNHIENPDRIAVGQQLRLNGDKPGEPAHAQGAEPWSQTLLRFVDAIGRPIANLAVRLVADGKEMKAKTDASGCINKVPCTKPEMKIEIHVERAKHKGGGEKHIGSYTPMAGQQTVRVQSSKQVEATKIRRHDGAPQEPPKKMIRETAGSGIETATSQGHPLTCVKCGECPNDDDLMLGPNIEFRDHIKTAAQRAGVMPQAVAAVMNAEAAKDKNGKWKADSKSPRSSATGMTQFLDASWIGEALRVGTYLNAKAEREGWLCKDAKGQLQFRKSDGTYVIGPNLMRKLTTKPLLEGRRTAGDDNLQKLLDLRLQPEYAIIAAMDYAQHNLDSLSAKGYDIGLYADSCGTRQPSPDGRSGAERVSRQVLQT